METLAGPFQEHSVHLTAGPNVRLNFRIFSRHFQNSNFKQRMLGLYSVRSVLTLAISIILTTAILADMVSMIITADTLTDISRRNRTA